MTTFDIFQDGESETASSDVRHRQTNWGWCSLVRSLTNFDNLVFSLTKCEFSRWRWCSEASRSPAAPRWWARAWWSPSMATTSMVMLMMMLILMTKVVSAGMVISNDGDHFDEPDKFLPERWIRGSPLHHTADPFAFLPFGRGPRWLLHCLKC